MFAGFIAIGDHFNRKIVTLISRLLNVENNGVYYTYTVVPDQTITICIEQ